MIWIQVTGKVDPRKQPAQTKMNMQSNAISWLFRISIAAAIIGGVGTLPATR